MKHIMEIRVGQDESGIYRAVEKTVEAGGSGSTVFAALTDLIEELDARAFWAGQTIKTVETPEERVVRINNLSPAVKS